VEFFYNINKGKLTIDEVEITSSKIKIIALLIKRLINIINAQQGD
jgi:hypothetical protein